MNGNNSTHARIDDNHVSPTYSDSESNGHSSRNGRISPVKFDFDKKQYNSLCQSLSENNIQQRYSPEKKLNQSSPKKFPWSKEEKIRTIATVCDIASPQHLPKATFVNIQNENGDEHEEQNDLNAKSIPQNETEVMMLLLFL